MATAFSIIFVLFIAMVIALQPPASRIDFERLADCIAMVETGSYTHPKGDDQAIGKQGELGRYQIQRQLWQQVSHLPFECATDPIASRKVAIRHLEWLERKLSGHESLERSRIYLVALGWNAGPQAVLHVFATRNQRDYAQRVENLYLDPQNK